MAVVAVKLEPFRQEKCWSTLLWFVCCCCAVATRSLLSKLDGGNLLLIGDSLTAGSVRNGNHIIDSHPYSIQLGRRLTEHGYNVSIALRANPGERLQSIVSRIKQELETYQPRCVVLMGGTNDLLASESAFVVFQRLSSVFRAILERKIFLIALAIPPEHQGEKHQIRNQKRLGVNGSINGTAASCPGKMAMVNTDTRPFAPDIGNISASLLLSEWNETQMIQKNVFSDGLHLTPMGYDILGEMVFLTLRDFQVTESPELGEGGKCAILES